MDKDELIDRLSEIFVMLHKINSNHEYPSLMRYEVFKATKKVKDLSDDIYYEDKIDITGKE